MALKMLVPAIGDVLLVPVWPNAGAPTSGTSGTFAGVAQPGDLLSDMTNKVLYQNTNTQASPTWTQVSNNPASVAITGGTIDGTTIGGTTPGAVTTNALHVDTGTKTATATAGAATLNKMAGVITSESLTTGAGADYTLTLTNSDIAAADQVYASVQLGTATTGTPAVAMVTPAAGSAVIVVQNIHASAALNGTIKISFLVVKN
ncbi:MAG: hypothetical protein KGO96_10065 [Elusimicrobia bacterium]|nr:hypothetical protein [Elusimicrobiota bacterium]